MLLTELTLYVIGNSLLSKRAIRNIKSICNSPELKNTCKLVIVDLSKNPGIAEKLQIIATPLLVKSFPKPCIKIVGDLSNQEAVISALELEEIKDGK